MVAFILKDNANGDSWKNIIVALNSRAEPVKLDIPSGKYTVICKDGKINMKGLGQVSGAELMVPKTLCNDYTSIEKGSKKINKDFVVQTKTHNTNGKDMEMVWEER